MNNHALDLELKLPPISARQALRKNLSQAVWFYLSIALLIVLSAGFGIFQSWHVDIENNLAGMSHEVSITAQQVDAQVSDATRVLDIAKVQFQKAMANGPVSDFQAHQILAEASNSLSLPGSVISQGLLFTADSSGKLYARNSAYPISPLRVEDRLYFKTLSQHPSLRFSVGDMAVGRTDGRVVFHVAVPLLSPMGQFTGIVFHQIPVGPLQNQLKSALSKSRGQLLVMVNPQAAAFAWPMQGDPKELDPALIQQMYDAAVDAERRVDTPGLSSAIHVVGDGYLAFSRSNTTGLITAERVSRQDMAIWTLQQHWQFYSFSVGITGLLLVLLLLHYRQASHLFRARLDSMVDELTQLSNRREFDDHFPMLWRQAMREHAQISALFIDVDHFKKFNDTYGHVHADKALRMVAQTLRDCVRRPLDFVCRWGGEEFVVLLPQTNAAGAMQLAEQIQMRIRHMSIELEPDIRAHVSVSIGLATLRVTSNLFENDLINLADKAMQQAKQNGRDRIYASAESSTENS